jgi:hypothetical protein
MKLIIVTQWVRVVMAQVPSNRSLANRLVVKSEGKARTGNRNGRPKPDESRMQALY